MKKLLITILCVLSIIFISGCCAGSMNVSPISTAKDSWNSWIDLQLNFNEQAKDDLFIMGEHLTTYNNEITKNYPNYVLLKNNFQSDKANLQDWDSYLSELNYRTTYFASNTSGLTGDAKEYADIMLTNMREYVNVCRSAEIDLEIYCSDFESYVISCEQGYPDETLLKHGNDAKDRAVATLQKTDIYIGAANDASQRLAGLEKNQLGIQSK